MKARPPTMRIKKRYILARVVPPLPGLEPRDLYFSFVEAVTTLFGDFQAARIIPVVIACGEGYVLIRCVRGYEVQARIALSTVTAVADRRIALHPVATSGTIHALKRKIAGKHLDCMETALPVRFMDKEYMARRYQGQKVDLLEKGNKRQELLFLIQEDLEES